MPSRIAHGLLAGAAGTVALNITTYADMAIRGRAWSNVPGEDANVLLHRVGIELPGEQEVAHASVGSASRAPQGPSSARLNQPERREQQSQANHQPAWPHNPTAQHRLTGLGALMGYGVGLGIGATYAIARPWLGKLPTPLAGAIVGLAAMAGSDVPSVALGVTNPKTWGVSGWIEDIIPHLIYGMVTVGVYQALERAERPAWRGWRAR